MMDLLKTFTFKMFNLNPFNLDVINFYLFIIFLIIILFMIYRQSSMSRAIDNLEDRDREILNRLNAIAGCMERKEKYKLERRLWALEQNQQVRFNKTFS